MKYLAVAALMTGALVVTGQAQDRVGQGTVFRSGAALVAVNVVVTDGRRNLVRDLRRDDFVVYEDGVRQDIQFFESSDVPLDLVLLIDTSSSMRDVMDVVHSAASGFMGSLRDEDRGAVVTFGDTVRIAQPLTHDKAAIDRAIRATRGDGGTALHNALYIALREFARNAQDASDVRRQAFALLSDGQDTTSVLSMDDVLEEVRRAGVTIYTIDLGPDGAPAPHLSRAFKESAFGLRRLAQETGGQAFSALHVRELQRIYSGIAEELASQYSIGYVPSNRESDGTFRRLTIQVTGGANLRARTRSGYVATLRGAERPAPTP